MRRKDREITDKSEILRILSAAAVCRLGLSDGDIPYIVPLSFIHDFSDDKQIIYLHGGKIGKKHDIIAKNPNACFEVDTQHSVATAEKPCDYGVMYESIIANGRVAILSDVSEKEKALTLLMKKYAPDRDFSFSEKEINMVKVLKLELNELSCKGRLA